MRTPARLAFALALAILPTAGCSPSTDGAEAPAFRPSKHDDGERNGPDFPGDALRWQTERWQDETGGIADGAWLRALRQREALVATPRPEHTAGVAPQSWRQRGPFNVAGRSRTLVIDPRDRNVLWSGGVGGGLWKSNDAGQNWTIVDDWWSNLAVASLTMDPSDPDTMYVGTGEGFVNVNVARGVNSSSVRGAGIFKSIDGGATWNHLPSTGSWPYTSRIAVSPNDPNVLLAAVRPGGIQRSTDGGQTWTQVDASFASYQVAFDPNDGQKAVAHVMDQSLATHRVLRSTDGGASWQPANSGLGNVAGYDARIELCYAASSPDVVYASVGEGGGRIWRSADGGANWVRRTTSGASACNWYYNGFWVDPTDENVMVVGAFHVWRSTDGGRTLTQITDGYIMTVDPHLDVHHVVGDAGYDGSGNRRVYVATDGGIHVADDILAARRGGGWRDLDDTQVSTQFYSAAGHAPSALLVAGSQDNGTQRLLGGSATRSNMTFGGDGGVVQIDPTNPSYVYGEYVWLRVFRSTNGGSSARFSYSGISEADSSGANFIAPLLLDPNDPRRLYGGASSLWRTDDARRSTIQWRPVKPSVGSFISAIAVADGDANQVWVGHNDGRVYRTTNGTAATPTWQAVDDNAVRDPLPNRYVERIVVDANDHRRVFVTLGGFSAGNVRLTDDAGATFTDASGTAPFRLPDAPVHGLCLHPDDSQVVYAATEVGLFASDDGGQHWSANNDGPANVSCQEVVFQHGSRTLLLATLGRGLWTAEVRRPGAQGYGAACANDPTPPLLTVDPRRPARIGFELALAASAFPPGSAAFLMLGISDTAWSGGSLPQPLDGIGMPGCALLQSNDVAFGATVDTGGGASWSLPLPADSNLLGQRLFTQAVGSDPRLNARGLATTGGVALTIGR